MLKPSEEDIMKIGTPEDPAYKLSMEWAENLIEGKIPEV